MHPRLVATPLLWLVLALPSTASELFPYRAVVIADEAAVRSGPGDNYYTVQKLARGEAVEVYRHDPGGWYAIRPPEGSFAWVAAEFIKAGEGGLGVVVGDRVVARVGSLYSDIRDVIQVRLNNGEEVEILDLERSTSAEGTKGWYKISPPAGEFRWVQARFVERESRGARINAEKEAADKNQTSHNKESAVSEGIAKTKSTEPSLYEPAPNTDSKPVAAAPPGDKLTALQNQLDQMSAQLEQMLGKKPATGWTGKDGVTTPRKSLPPSKATTVPEMIGELELQLSEIVADDTLVWDFRQITGRAEEALSRAESAADRARARALLFKIEKFEDIRQRYMAVVAQRNAAERDPKSTATSQLPRRVDLETTDGAPRYDGVGRLTQVIAQKSGAPQYALLNEQGKVLYYVSPAPGVNLRPYLDRDIGVTGILGYLPDQDVRHVTAKHVEPLEGRSLR